MESPFGLAIDSLDNIYVANSSNGTISKFSPTGTFLTSWSTGSTGPFFLAFKPTPTAVPEPSTYALAAIASGVMAAVARRRKARMG